MSDPVNRRTFMALMGAVGAGLILPATLRRAQAGEPPAAAPGGAPAPAPTGSAPALLVADRTDSNRVIPAKIHPSGFTRADSCWNSLSLASDGRLYFTLSIHAIDGYARLFRYDPATDEVKQLADLGELTGEAARKMIPQGKSHSAFYEYEGKVYTGSHYGYFRTEGNKEQPAAPPAGYLPYPGGHIISCDLRTGACEDVAVTVPEEGLQTMTLDPARGRIYGLTWPHGFFLTYDLRRRELRNLGKVSRDGEMGEGDRYFCLCRALGVVPETGDVYFTNADGEILRYRLEKDAVESVQGVTMRRDAFGSWDPSRPGHQGYNWRDIFWHAGHRVFYGVHPRSAWLFRFDPAEPRLEPDRTHRRGRNTPLRRLRAFPLRLYHSAPRRRPGDDLLPHRRPRPDDPGGQARQGDGAPDHLQSPHRPIRGSWTPSPHGRALPDDEPDPGAPSERAALRLSVDRESAFQ